MSDDTLRFAIRNRRSVRKFSDKAVPLEVVELLIQAGQGISGSGGQRVVPSAHALYPLTLFLVSGNVENLAQGLHRVAPEDGQLALVGKRDVRADLKSAAVDDQTWLAEAPLVISICADFIAPTCAFADQKPYGRRGPTYVAIEAGAAAQNMMLQATSLGLGSVLVAGFDDDRTSKILGLGRPLSPVLHICFGWAPDD